MSAPRRGLVAGLVGALLLGPVSPAVALPGGMATLGAAGAIADGAGALPAQPAGLTIDPQPAGLTIDQVIPALARPSDLVRLRGSLDLRGAAEGVPTGTPPRLSVRVATPARSIADLAGAPTRWHPSGPAGDPIPLAGPVVLTPVAAQQWTWQVTVAAAEVFAGSPPRTPGPGGLDRAGVSAVHVHAHLGDTEVGHSLTELPWHDGTPPPTQVVLLWPVTAAPVQPAPVSDRERLTRLLRAGAVLRPDWLVDPALMATNARAEVREAVAQGRVWALPTAVVDADPLVRTGSAPLVRSAAGSAAAAVAAALAEPAGLSGDPPGATVSGILAPSARLDRASAAALARAGVTAVVLPAARVRRLPGAVDRGPVVRLRQQPLLALLTDAGLLAALDRADAAHPSSLLALRQRLLGAALLAGAAGQPLIVAPPVTWDADPATLTLLTSLLAGTPWLTVAPLADVLARSRPDEGLLRRPSSRGLTPPPLQPWQTIHATDAALDQLASITPDPSDFAAPTRQALMRAGSSWWRDEPQRATMIAAEAAAAVAAGLAAVTVLSSGDVVLPGTTGDLPVTIANDLAVPVRVGLLITTNTARVRASPVPPVIVPAGRKVSTSVPLTVIGTAPITLVIALTDPMGRPLSAGQRVTVRSAAYGRVAQVAALIAVAALLLFSSLGISARVRKVHRDRYRRRS